MQQMKTSDTPPTRGGGQARDAAPPVWTALVGWNKH